MLNFRYRNPVEIVFGKGMIAELANLVPEGKILMTFGGGSIKSNGVYDQVKKALGNRTVFEFGGIEPNPKYETLMKAVELVRDKHIDFLLSVGGGSVLDGTKFIAAAARFPGVDPWAILEQGASVNDAVPLGSVITLPATGSEMNSLAVISRNSSTQKLAFGSPHVFPKFSILDPETTFTLSLRQVANGIVDTFVHVCEQYITFPVNAPLQDRQAEAILLTLIEEGPKVGSDPKNYDVRANLMWAATQALNGWLNCGVPQDWTTHAIGHELTALTGTDHARTLALVMPALWKHQGKEKHEKLLQFAERVFGIKGKAPEKVIDQAIEKTKEFFVSVGLKASKKEYGITEEHCKTVAETLGKRGKLGERGNLGEREILQILELCEA